MFRNCLEKLHLLLSRVVKKYSNVLSRNCAGVLFKNFLPWIAISCFAASFLTPSIVRDLFPLNNDFSFGKKPET